MSHRKHLIVGLGVLLTLLGSVSAAEAQGYPPPYYPPPPPMARPRGVYRSGLIFGFSGGLGALGRTDYSGNPCNGPCGFAFSGEAHIGGMISPRAALMFEVWGADHPWTDTAGNSFESINTFFTGAAQYWVNDVLWLKGGLGVGYYHDTINNYYYGAGVVSTDLTSASGFALFGALGVEVVQFFNFAMDIQGRIGSGFYSQSGSSFSAQNYAVMLGFNWY